jgi:hypothetical protein
MSVINISSLKRLAHVNRSLSLAGQLLDLFLLIHLADDQQKNLEYFRS